MGLKPRRNRTVIVRRADLVTKFAGMNAIDIARRLGVSQTRFAAFLKSNAAEAELPMYRIRKGADVPPVANRALADDTDVLSVANRALADTADVLDAVSAIRDIMQRHGVRLVYIDIDTGNVSISTGGEQ